MQYSWAYKVICVIFTYSIKIFYDSGKSKILLSRYLSDQWNIINEKLINKSQFKKLKQKKSNVWSLFQYNEISLTQHPPWELDYVSTLGKKTFFEQWNMLFFCVVYFFSSIPVKLYNVLYANAILKLFL